MTPIEVVLQFVDAVNAKDLPRIASLMTDDHRFIDSLGAAVSDVEEMRRGWQVYLEMVPDYWIEVDETYSNGEVVVLLGTASGTYTTDGLLRAENAWSTPAAWRARVRGNHIAEWQVFADNEPMRRRMASRHNTRSI